LLPLGIFRDYGGTLLGCFASNLSAYTVFEEEMLVFIIAMEQALFHGWTNLWLGGAPPVRCWSSKILIYVIDGIIV